MPGSWRQRPEVDADGGRVVGELLTASRLLVAIAARSLAAVEESLTLPQYRMLVVLDAQGPVSLARMAELLDANPSTALRMVERLSAAGMAEKSPTRGTGAKSCCARLPPAGRWHARSTRTGTPRRPRSSKRSIRSRVRT